MSTINERGSFVVIESNDRAGKTTICENIIKSLPNSVYLKFPNREGKNGKIINDYLNNLIDIPKDEIYKLFVENRLHERDNIISLLESGKNIICDRYCYSGIVYATFENMGLFNNIIADTNFGSINKPDTFNIKTNFGNKTIIHDMNNLLNNESDLPKPDIIFLINGSYRDGSNERYDNTNGIYELFKYWFTNGTNEWKDVNNYFICESIIPVNNIYDKDSIEYKVIIEHMIHLIKDIKKNNIEFINEYCF